MTLLLSYWFWFALAFLVLIAPALLVLGSFWMNAMRPSPTNFSGVAELQTRGGGNGVLDDAGVSESTPAPMPSGGPIRAGAEQSAHLATRAGASPAATDSLTAAESAMVKQQIFRKLKTRFKDL